MSEAWTIKLAFRKHALARLFVPMAVAASGAAGAADTASAVPAAQAGAACACGGAREYSVINLGAGEDWGAYLNQKGQVATYGPVSTSFFDGDRLHAVGSLGGGYTFMKALNNRGVLVGESEDNSEPFGNIYAVWWSAGKGMHALPSQSGSTANAINDRNQVAGHIPAYGALLVGRAVRWDPNGKLVDLGPLPYSYSDAWAINNHGETGGFADVAPGPIHATKWSLAGSVNDLGLLPGNFNASVSFLNQRGEAAGMSDANVFFWSAATGMVAIGAHSGEGIGQVIGLNERGQVAGNTESPGGRAAYLWSRSHGLVLLPGPAGVETRVSGMNNRTQMVGWLYGASDIRAVRWDGPTAPVDLTSRLHNPPAGLVLIGGEAINDAGDIVAYSNAGMVLLRPGSRGTDAPVLGPIAGLPDNVTTGADLQFTLGFVDNSPTQTHTAAVTWDDGCTSPAPLLQESGGVGQVRFQHHFCASGAFAVSVKVTDSGGRATEVRKIVYVNDPAASTLNGNGTLATARGLPVHFALWVPVSANAVAPATAARSGAPVVRFAGPFRFQAEQIGSATRSGQAVHVEGTGRFNGRPGYRFAIDASDGQMHARVSHTDAGGTEVVDFDNRPQLAAASLAGSAAAANIAHGWLKVSN